MVLVIVIVIVIMLYRYTAGFIGEGDEMDSSRPRFMPSEADIIESPTGDAV